MVFNKISVPVEGVLSRSFQRVKIDSYDSECRTVSAGPFEIIKHRPDEVAADIDAAFSGFKHGVDIAVKKFNSHRIVHLAVTRESIVKIGAVFGDNNRRARISIVNRKQQISKMPGIDLPLETCPWQSRWRRDLFISQGSLRIRLDVRAGIVIDSKKVDFLPRDSQIPGLNKRFDIRKYAVRVLPGKKWPQERIVPQIIVFLSHQCGSLRIVGGNGQMQIQRRPELKRSVNRPQPFNGCPLCEI